MSLVPRPFISVTNELGTKVTDVPLLMQSSEFLSVCRWCCTHSHNYTCASCFLWSTAQNAKGGIQFRYWACVFIHIVCIVHCWFSCPLTLNIMCQLCPPSISCFLPHLSHSLFTLCLSLSLSFSSCFFCSFSPLLHAGLLKLGLRTTFFHIADQLQRFVEVTDIWQWLLPAHSLVLSPSFARKNN